MRRYYVGAPHPGWLWQEGPRFPMCVSRRWLAPRKTLGRALVPWILDSGGFTELTLGSLPARWSVSPEQYVAEVARFDEEIGGMQWAAPMDWMCEDDVRRRTGLTVDQHQHLTVSNYLLLRALWPRYGTGECKIIPVIQGWSAWSYVRCRELYEAEGVDLSAVPVVGVGSICRRPNPLQVASIISLLDDLPLHAFGCKVTGLSMFAGSIQSADSMAWSKDASHNPPMPGHEARHQHCTCCREYAADWYEDRLGRFGLAA